MSQNHAAPGSFLLGTLLGAALVATAWLASTRQLLGTSQRNGSSTNTRTPKKKGKKHLKRGQGPEGKDVSENQTDPFSGRTREVLQQDAVEWLKGLETGLPPNSCILTGVPDVHEVDPEGKLGMEGWEAWFREVVQLMLNKLPDDSLAIFMQTDVKQLSEGGGGVSQGGNASGSGGANNKGKYWRWVDKSHLAISAAEGIPGTRLLWHKIIFSGNMSAGAGRNSGVAGYSHYLCFTKGDKPESMDSFPFPDVLRKGLATWVSGSGIQSLLEVVSHLKARGCTTLVDPFCGEGAVLAIANYYGMDAIGVEITKKRAKVAMKQDGARLVAAEAEESNA
mmetsp:Transcript_25882/g.56245  ORF Transcript_25882/g.56245 Transcript_25882/m.56245 type:complete len:336 (+) Transcript_25882:104-1111(+)